MEKIFISLLMTFFFSNIALAEETEKWYQIETIVFENLAKNLKSEDFDSEQPKLPLYNSIELRPTLADNAGLAYVELDNEELNLKQAYYNLKRSKNFKVLLHKAWRQPIDLNNPKKIHLFGGDNLTASNNSYYNDYNGELWEVDGTITPIKTTYLHIATNFVFRKNLNTIMRDEPEKRYLWQNFRHSSAANKLYNFVIDEKRKVRTGDLYYFDHPAFGVIVRVDSVDAPKQPTTTNAGSETY